MPAKLERPDEGRAWVVVFAACIINMILSGLSRMIGILYVYVLKDYGTTRQEATLPFTTRNAVRTLSGPLVGIIGQRFGIRTVTFMGGVIASLGAALCYTAPNITWLTVFWGGIHGCGFAFANTLFQVVVNQYFEKYRATASGIALSGACVGSLGFPFMIEAILDTFGLTGSFLILAGVVMHVLPPSLLLTVPQWVRHPEAYARLLALQNADQSVETLNTVVLNKSESAPPMDSSIESCRFRISRSTSLDNCPVENLDICKSTRHRSAIRFENSESSSGKDSVVCTLYKIQESPLTHRNGFVQEHQNGNSVTLNRSPETNHSNALEPNSDSRKSKDELWEQSSKGQEQTPNNCAKTTNKKANNQSFKEILLSSAYLYKNPVYILISVCMSTYMLIFIPILTVIVDYSLDKGIPASAGKYLINAMAIGDLIGRLCFGWVTDKKYMTIPSFLALVLLLQGASIALFPYSTSLPSLAALLILYGMTAGSILVLFPVLVLQYVDNDSQAVGMANVGFIAGLVSFVIPPMIGYFRDELGSYDGMFFLTGGISVISGGMWLLPPVVDRAFNKGKNQQNDSAPEPDPNEVQSIQVGLPRDETKSS